MERTEGTGKTLAKEFEAVFTTHPGVCVGVRLLYRFKILIALRKQFVCQQLHSLLLWLEFIGFLLVKFECRLEQLLTLP